MTQQIDQLALVRLGFEAHQSLNSIQLMDLEQNLWYARTQEVWNDGKQVTVKDREAIFAQEIIKDFGHEILAIAHKAEIEPSIDENPLYDGVMSQLGSLITFTESAKGDRSLIEAFNPRRSSYDYIDDAFMKLFETRPELMGEYWVKRCLALDIYHSKPHRMIVKDEDAEVALEVAVESVIEAEHAITHL